MTVLTMLVKVLLFPGFLFLCSCAAVTAFLDRKLYARMQNRVGPRWFIPIADFFKLIGKQSLIPADANRGMVQAMPYISLAGVASAFVYIPVVGNNAAFAFKGDLIIVLYFLTFPVVTQFLAGWYSRSLYATVGAYRVVTQMFAYEIPMFMSLLSPALISGTWSVSESAAFYAAHPLYIFINLPAFVVALAASQCKLSRMPFDAPEAETEIVSGPFVEYGGRLLAFFHLSVDCETVVVISLISAIFLPWTTGVAVIDVLLYFVKTLFVLFIMILMRAVMARLRVNQTVTLCWKGLAPVAMLQMILNLIVRGALQ